MSEIQTSLAGRLTADPVVRDLGGGREVVSFRVACNHGFMDRTTGQWKESSTSFVSVDVWRRALGRNVAGSLTKGDPVMVQGRLYVREYEQEGRARIAVTLIADAVGPDLNTAMAAVTRVRRGPDGAVLADHVQPGGHLDGAAPEGAATAQVGPVSEAPEPEAVPVAGA